MDDGDPVMCMQSTSLLFEVERCADLRVPDSLHKAGGTPQAR
jgi:hypothetical protein